jgi:RimJ/RimL family protein N-acetyltransferase
MRINTERLYLRPLADADCTQAYVEWLNDPEVNRFLETRYVVQTPSSVRDFVRSVNAHDREHLFGIFLRAGDRHIGNIKVGPIGIHHPLADVSLFIGDRQSWGLGYASEAIAALSRYAFNELGVKKLSAGMYALNAGSYHAFRKAGFQEEGRRRRHYMYEGQLCDVVELGLCIGDLP